MKEKVCPKSTLLTALGSESEASMLMDLFLLDLLRCETLNGMITWEKDSCSVLKLDTAEEEQRTACPVGQFMIGVEMEKRNWSLTCCGLSQPPPYPLFQDNQVLKSFS